MKYRYIYVNLDGTEPQGTDDLELAKKVAKAEEDAWVIDTETGQTLDTNGDFDVDISDIDPGDYADEDEDEEEGDDAE